jgi:hypothetical protein
MGILVADDRTGGGASDAADLQNQECSHGEEESAQDDRTTRQRRKAGAVNKRPLSQTLQMPPATPSGHPVGPASSPHPNSMHSMASASNTMDPVWQRLWLRCQQHDWQSMAFIGSSKRDPDGVLEIAHGMARLASELGQELTVFDARNLGLKDMGRMLAQIQSITSRGKRCIVVLKLVTENATTVPMAQNVDAALLGVFIGETSVIASSRTVDEVGRAKFLGSVVLNASLAK